MKREEAMKLVEEGIAALNEALRNGHSETLKRFLDTVARFHRYSVNNAILIAAQRPDATQVAGFHTWRKFGRCVQKGEHGIAIFAPMSRRKDCDERVRCSAFHGQCKSLFLAVKRRPSDVHEEGLDRKSVV